MNMWRQLYSRGRHISRSCIKHNQLQIKSRFLLGHQSIRCFSMKIFNCPEAGEGQTEIDILEWFVKPGDKVKTFDVIGSAKYEKADLDIHAPYDGVVHKLFVDAGNVAQIHKPLIEFDVDGGDSSSTPESSSTEQPTTTESQPSESPQSQIQSQTNIDTGIILTTPAVRRIAKENNIDLNIVPGSGKDGRILKEDMLDFISGKLKPKSPTQPQSIPIPTAPSTPVTQIKTPMPSPLATQDFVEKIIGVKRAMVKKMTEANQVPQFGYGDEINMTSLVSLRQELKPLSEQYGVKLSFMPFIIKAVSLSLINYSSLNAHVTPDCDQLIHRGSHNIGVAIDSPQGLIVPNIKNCESKSIVQIAQDLDSLIQRARNSEVTTDDITGGTFSLSNIGAIGGTYCNPICFVPEVCIGALGAFQMLPRYNKNGELKPTPVMAVSWSADHRVIDGATVARFSNQWKQHLENPGSMLLHMK